MKKEFETIESAAEFVANLIEEKKWLVLQPAFIDNKYIVEWIEHKKYTTFDNKEFPDELWVTEKGEPLLVQDMSEAHVRNALRMLLRNQRLRHEYFAKLADQMINQSLIQPEENIDDIEDYTGDEVDDETVRLLKQAFDPELAAASAREDASSEMTIPAHAIKGPTTLQ